ncbi:hypothetical protein Glove_346g135 [Diversispora epigaea]|uniref:Uncharacterized protein n=1 Tax=Diversispora epigaea TaxID=1348612 RepID=A0A397HEX0_9GLOM|nr:hypothetical protein Glove_346g131 [Diversispora epigaea]RHZ61649.1 hypothetical protein Glove_346g135 [Diversispora epigaea]
MANYPMKLLIVYYQEILRYAILTSAKLISQDAVNLFENRLPLSQIDNNFLNNILQLRLDGYCYHINNQGIKILNTTIMRNQTSWYGCNHFISVWEIFKTLSNCNSLK